MRTLRRFKHPIWIDVVMLPCLVIFVLPFYFLVINTFKTQRDAAFNPMGWPEQFIFTNYIDVFDKIPVLLSLFNSTFITACAVVLVVMFGAMAAYPIVYNKTRLNQFFMFYLLAGFLIPFQSIVLAVFQTMNELNLLNTLHGMILFYSSNCAFAFFLTMGYMRTVPRVLHEAATVDGAGIFVIFWRIVLPLIVPILATSSVYMAIQIWNDFLAPNLFINSQSKLTLVLQIYKAKGEFNVEWPLFMTMATLTLIPILIFYVFMQKYIIRGLVAGAIKG